MEKELRALTSELRKNRKQIRNYHTRAEVVRTVLQMIQFVAIVVNLMITIYYLT